MVCKHVFIELLYQYRQKVSVFGYGAMNRNYHYDSIPLSGYSARADTRPKKCKKCLTRVDFKMYSLYIIDLEVNNDDYENNFDKHAGLS
jgi:hypothetical protein